MRFLQILIGVAVFRSALVLAVASKGLPRLFSGSERHIISINSHASLQRGGIDAHRDRLARHRSSVLGRFGSGISIGSFSVQDPDEENKSANASSVNSSNSTDEVNITESDENESANSTPTIAIATATSTTTVASANMTNDSFVRDSIEDLETLYPYLNVSHTEEDENKDRRGMIQLPNFDAGSGLGHSYLMQSPGSTIVSKDTHCRLSTEECTWVYSEKEFFLRVQSPDVCGNEPGNNFSCCLTHSDTPDDTSVSIGRCLECSETRCEWCMTSLGDDFHVIHPKVADSCPGCVNCRCLGAKQNGGEAEVSVRAAGDDGECNMMWIEAS